MSDKRFKHMGKKPRIPRCAGFYYNSVGLVVKKLIFLIITSIFLIFAGIGSIVGSFFAQVGLNFRSLHICQLGKLQYGTGTSNIVPVPVHTEYRSTTYSLGATVPYRTVP